MRGKHCAAEQASAAGVGPGDPCHLQRLCPLAHPPWRKPSWGSSLSSVHQGAVLPGPPRQQAGRHVSPVQGVLPDGSRAAEASWPVTHVDRWPLTHSVMDFVWPVIY